MKTLALAALLAFAAKPSWISIEVPVNPYDASVSGAFLLARVFHYNTTGAFPIAGTAEGIINGDRRSLPLEFTETSRPGVYALKQTWPKDGTWTLVIRALQGSPSATALVELGAGGEVLAVRVPTRVDARGTTLPADVAMADVDRALRARAGQVARQ
jgi:hypothetical protein